MSTPEIQARQRRENPDPTEANRPIPTAVLVLIGVLVVFGALYILFEDINVPSDWGDGRVAADLEVPRKEAQAGAAAIDGASLFSSLCAACHQATGQGLPGVFPPLAGSGRAQGNEAALAAVVLHGISGSLTTQAGTFNGMMPSFKDQLDDAQLAAVLTFVRSQWGNAAGPVPAASVAAARAEHQARTAPFTEGKDLPAYR